MSGSLCISNTHITLSQMRMEIGSFREYITKKHRINQKKNTSCTYYIVAHITPTTRLLTNNSHILPIFRWFKLIRIGFEMHNDVAFLLLRLHFPCTKKQPTRFFVCYYFNWYTFVSILFETFSSISKIVCQLLSTPHTHNAQCALRFVCDGK